MPSVTVDQEHLFASLGCTYTVDEFRELCFEYGIELEEATSELQQAIAQLGEQEARRKNLSERPLFKIDIPANRCDLLSAETIIYSLAMFLGKADPMYFDLQESTQTIHVKANIAEIRPIVQCAVVRGIKFTETTYRSFIEMQDKLHHNICRKRTLASMGTHDLDKIAGPFVYEADAPTNICFVALNESKTRNAAELLQHYKTVKHLAKFVEIIQDFPEYPVIRDAKDRVCSMPPIINSEFSKITMETTNVFIECTATDNLRCHTALMAIVGMLATLPGAKVEQVKVVYPDKTVFTPTMSIQTMQVPVSSINKTLGITLTADEILKLLKRMGYRVHARNDTVDVDIPPCRADVLHACDIAEDVAIAYGYNRLPRRVPDVFTVGKPLPINTVSDGVRIEMACAGWTEVMPLVLCGLDEAFSKLQLIEKDAVVLKNPRTAEFQIVRPSLVPGLLKTIKENRACPLPMRLFEVGDVVIKDERDPRRARNERRLCAVYVGMRSAFQVIHGLLDQMFLKLDAKYTLSESRLPMFLPGSGADIFVDDKCIGVMGVLHPKVLENYEIGLPVTLFEFCIQGFE